MTETLHETSTLAEAKAWLRARVRTGAKCPVCNQKAKVYLRRLHSTLARALITLWQHGGAMDYQHAPSLPGDTHEISQLKWWGLIEEKPKRRDDGGHAGWYRLTAKGLAFLNDRVQVTSHAVIYDGECMGFKGDRVDLQDCLGTNFDLRELMSA